MAPAQVLHMRRVVRHPRDATSGGQHSGNRPPRRALGLRLYPTYAVSTNGVSCARAGFRRVSTSSHSRADASTTSDRHQHEGDRHHRVEPVVEDEPGAARRIEGAVGDLLQR